MADFPIVGIGSSAGGLEALEKLFDVIEIEGEPVPLAPHQGLGLSLVMHELGTNAAKYGALSPSDGRVRVSWQVEQGDDAGASGCFGRSAAVRVSNRRPIRASARGSSSGRAPMNWKVKWNWITLPAVYAANWCSR